MYFKINKIFYDTRDKDKCLTGKEIDEVLERNISTLNSVGITYLFESQIIQITEKEKDDLFKFLENRDNKRKEDLINLIKGWKEVLLENMYAYLQNTIKKINSLKTKK